MINKITAFNNQLGKKLTWSKKMINGIIDEIPRMMRNEEDREGKTIYENVRIYYEKQSLTQNPFIKKLTTN